VDLEAVNAMADGVGVAEEHLGRPPGRALVVEPDAEGVQQGGPLGRREIVESERMVAARRCITSGVAAAATASGDRSKCTTR
jgi:hypothetical protein